MGYVVTMPKFGLEMQEGELVAWHVSVGDSIDEDQTIAEVESEKTMGEITAKEAGILRSIFLSEGDVAPPGTPVGIIAAGDEDIDELQKEAESKRDGTEVLESSGSSNAPGVDDSSDEAGSDTASSVIATPKARKKAREHGLELADIEGTGPKGAVTADDVEASAARSSDGAKAAKRTVRESRKLGPMRSTIAQRLGESYRNAVHVTASREISANQLVDAAGVETEPTGSTVALTDLVIWCVSETLAEHPEFNAVFEDEQHRLIEERNVSFAVDVDDGLVTPVIPDVGSLSLDELAERRRVSTQRALDGDFTMDELSGGTFTVSNLGALGVDSFTPIINPPQVAILGVGRVRDGPSGSEDRRLTFDLSFDHRVVDGADAARFLSTLADNCENVWETLPDDVDTPDEIP